MAMVAIPGMGGAERDEFDSFEAITWQWAGSPNSDPITINRLHWEGGVRYAVRRGGDCLSRDGEWVREPLPSNRRADFADVYRFPTFDAAADVVRRLTPTALSE